ncbi:hypothetical protein ACE6H2_006568 [Prunus campanulata]
MADSPKFDSVDDSVDDGDDHRRRHRKKDEQYSRLRPRSPYEADRTWKSGRDEDDSLFSGSGFGFGVYALRLSHSATPSEQKLEFYARKLSLTSKLTNPKTHALNTETTMALGFPIGN